MKQVIKQVGPFTLKPRRDRFYTLTRGIVGQQISTTAAETIFQRLVDLVAPQPLSEAALVGHTIETLGAAGISRQKASYLLDLTQRIHEGHVDLKKIGRLNDQQVIEHLVQVKGIGPWSAKMFLIFSLGRLDIIAADDLGIRNAVGRHYQFEETPTAKEVETLAEPWAPYRTIASWYLWQSLDLK